jgi:hypothetical protein
LKLFKAIFNLQSLVLTVLIVTHVKQTHQLSSGVLRSMHRC